LDELKSRLENLQSRLDNANKAIEAAEVRARETEERYESARAIRAEDETSLHEAEARLGEKRRENDRLENDRRGKSEERSQQLAQHSRLKAQLEVLEPA